MRICDGCKSVVNKVEVTFNRIKASQDRDLGEDTQLTNNPEGVDLCVHCMDKLSCGVRKLLNELIGKVVA